MNYAFPLYDLEEKIMDAWNIIQDIKILNFGVQDQGISMEEISQGLCGLKVLYELKFDIMYEQYKKFYPDNTNEESMQQWSQMNFPFPLIELEEKIMDAWKVTDELKLLFNHMQKKELSVDYIANVLLGLEYLYELKMQDLFDQFSLLHKSSKDNYEEKILETVDGFFSHGKFQ